MELRHLRYFVVVAEELHFTRAATRLHTSQPSLSQQIRQLEGHVGAPLFERTRHRVALTAAGHVFLREAREILDRVVRASFLATEAAAGRAAELNVGTSAGADAKILPALRPLLASQLPDIRLVLRSRYVVEPIAGLRNGLLDVVFLRGPVAEEGIESVHLLIEPIVVALPATHPLARRKRIAARLLDDVPCITVTRSASPALHDAIVGVYRRAGLRMRTVSEADNVLGHLNQIQTGLGLALLPDYVTAILPPGVVVRPLDADPAPTVSLALAWRAGARAAAVDTFIGLVRQCCRSLPGGASQTGRRRASAN